MIHLATLTQEERVALWAWCRTQSLEVVTHSSYVRGRTERWFRLGSNLQSLPKGRAKIVHLPDVEDALVLRIGDTFLPSWNSLLLCGGNTSIEWHRDHGHFLNEAVSCNLGRGVIQEDLPNGVLRTELVDGVIYALDVSRPHLVTQTSTERYSLTYRTIATRYLPG